MSRVKSGPARHKRVKKTLKAAKGYWGGRHRLYRTAKEAVMRAGAYAYVGRRLKKRDFRQLWIIRIAAAARAAGISYSRLMNGLKKARVDLDRKMLAELAVNDAKSFGQLVELARSSL